MEVTLTFIFALLGIAIGSFLNVCIDRLPAGKSLIRPPSYCDACNQRISTRDLIPVFSYLWLRGRCRYCQVRIPQRVFWVELGSGLLFAFLYYYWYRHYGLNVAEFAVIAFYCCLFIVIGIIDLEHKIILNKMVYPAAVAALVISAFLPQSGLLNLPWPDALSGIVNSIIGGAIGFLILFIPAIINPRGMGWGDVKMAGLIGLVTGSKLVFAALFLGIIVGGLIAASLLLLKVKKRKELIPFGPFLSLATIATLLWGGDILNWYLALF